jgi:tRNA threonylcarbamoyladenosine biosynthesis protein TsaE
METFTTTSPQQTIDLGRQLAQRLDQGDCVALIGQLGAGKTVLAKGLAVGLGLDDDKLVSSPTFVLIQEYPGRVPIFHVDLYRLGDPAGELGGLGLTEMCREGVVIVEWADRAEQMLPKRHWRIRIEATGDQERTIALERVD